MAIGLDWQFFAFIMFFTGDYYTWTLIVVQDFKFEFLIIWIGLTDRLDTRLIINREV
jgi:hypothetical protein